MFPSRLPLVLAVALAACGGSDAPDAGSPRPVGSGAPEGLSPETAGPPAEAAPGDPRMVLFDVQTGLEAERSGSGSYPVPEAFRYEERWRGYRDRLDAAFDGWDYDSDGEIFRLRGTIEERAWGVSGP